MSVIIEVVIYAFIQCLCSLLPLDSLLFCCFTGMIHNETVRKRVMALCLTLFPVFHGLKKQNKTSRGKSVYYWHSTTVC